MAHQHRPAEPDAEINAYNAAFEELGLGWQWDADVMRELQAIPGERERIAQYLRCNHPHLLTVYPVDFLATAITQTKARFTATRAP